MRQTKKNLFFLSSFLAFSFAYSGLFLPTRRCRGLLFHLIAHVDAYTIGRTPLDEGSALCMTTQYSHETDRHPCSQRDSNSQSQEREAKDAGLRSCGHWDRRSKTQRCQN